MPTLHLFVWLLGACLLVGCNGPSGERESMPPKLRCQAIHVEQSIRVNDVTIDIGELEGWDHRNNRPNRTYTFGEITRIISPGATKDFGATGFIIRSDGNELSYLNELLSDYIESLTFRSCMFRLASSDVIRFKKLNFVWFEDCTSTDQNFLAHLKPMTGMKTIGLIGVKLSEEDLAWILANENLEQLWLDKATLSPRSLALICRELRDLKDLSLKNVKGLKPGDLQPLKELGKLEILDVGGLSLKDEDVQALSNITTLRELNLSGTDITDSQMEYVGRLARLEALWINSTEVSDAGILKLRHCSKLKTVETYATDVAIESLVRLQTLIEGGLKKVPGSVDRSDR